MTNDTQRTGKIMAYIAWLLFFALTGWFFQKFTEHQNNPNQQVNSLRTDNKIEVKLVANRQHAFVASGKINSQPVTFLVDTGATSVSIPEGLANKIGLRRGTPITLLTAAGPAPGYTTHIDSLELGEIKLHNLRGVISPNRHSNEVLFGMSAIKQLDFSLENNILTLRQRVR